MYVPCSLPQEVVHVLLGERVWDFSAKCICLYCFVLFILSKICYYHVVIFTFIPLHILIDKVWLCIKILVAILIFSFLFLKQIHYAYTYMYMYVHFEF